MKVLRPSAPRVSDLFGHRWLLADRRRKWPVDYPPRSRDPPAYAANGPRAAELGVSRTL